MPSLEKIESAARTVHAVLQATPQINWPLLSERCGCEVWTKHENHNPTGAFKVRGGLTYLGNLKRSEPATRGVCTATRGNHGQSVAFAAAHYGLEAVIVVPEGNNPEKNAAIRALGAELIVHGRDFDEALPFAQNLARERELHQMPPFHHDLVLGVASYSLEFLRAVPDLERVYVPIGLGSGICGMIAVRNGLGLETEIVGVVAENAPTYLHSFAAGRCLPTESADTVADGLALRIPSEQSLGIMLDNVARVVAVSEESILESVGHYFTDTHNLAEGAAAAPLAATLLERDRNHGSKIGLVLSGGNIDRETLVRSLR
ncbi:MAG: threonine dehydratase [Gammaproteobacteria bacterium]|nr:MAG: threonine dehydratase [Gammaproteobacteria bacterium]